MRGLFVNQQRLIHNSSTSDPLFSHVCSLIPSTPLQRLENSLFRRYLSHLPLRASTAHFNTFLDFISPIDLLGHTALTIITFGYYFYQPVDVLLPSSSSSFCNQPGICCRSDIPTSLLAAASLIWSLSYLPLCKFWNLAPYSTYQLINFPIPSIRSRLEVAKVLHVPLSTPLPTSPLPPHPSSWLLQLRRLRASRYSPWSTRSITHALSRNGHHLSHLLADSR